MTARFEIHVESRASSLLPSLIEGADFSVFSLGISMESLSYDNILFDEESPYHWVWARKPSATLGECQGEVHVG